MILCLTPNPAIDRTLLVPRLARGDIHRATQTIVAAGGKGLNVARAIRILGGEVTCAGFLGGHSGRLLADLAEAEGLHGQWTWIAGETRTCVIVVEETATVINEPGPTVTASEWARLRADVLTREAEFVCVSGSLPPESPVDAYAQLMRDLSHAGKHVWVDTSGAALAGALKSRINLKVNSAEAEAVLQMKVETPETALSAAQKFHAHGAPMVVITLGSFGAVLVSAAGHWAMPAPAIQALSAVGSGDAFLGGLVTALAAGQAPPEALRWGVAAGAANALSPGGGAFTLEEFQRLLVR